MSRWPWSSGKASAITLGELREGWKRVRKGSDAAGVDGIRGSGAVRHEDALLAELAADLARGTYAPLPFKTASIPKAGGGERTLHIPAVRDRIVQQVLAHRLMQRFEPTFHPGSWAYRPGRGREGAVRYLVGAARERGLGWIARIDIRAFFDSIVHERLLSMLTGRGVPEDETRLVRLTLGAGILDGHRVERVRRGCPQGSPLSPVLSNIYLDGLDHWLGAASPGACRYADDMAIPCASEAQARRTIDAVRRFLASRLELALHPEKTCVVRLHQLEFLGYRFDVLHAVDEPVTLWQGLCRLAAKLVARRR